MNKIKEDPIAKVRDIIYSTKERYYEEDWGSLMQVTESCQSKDDQAVLAEYIKSHTENWPEEIKNPHYNWGQEMRGHSHLKDLCPDTSTWALTKGSYPGERREVWAMPDMHVVWIPPGEFLMGASPDDEEATSSEKPQTHQVIQNGFWMAETPVTQAQYVLVTNSSPSAFSTPTSVEMNKEMCKERPVETVSFHDSEDFCNKMAGSWRIPNEAEWEYACRAGSTGSRPPYLNEDGQVIQVNRENVGDIAWFSDNSENSSQPVRMKKPNLWGLYDMLGNVWEWCSQVKKGEG